MASELLAWAGLYGKPTTPCEACRRRPALPGDNRCRWCARLPLPPTQGELDFTTEEDTP